MKSTALREYGPRARSVSCCIAPGPDDGARERDRRAMDGMAKGGKKRVSCEYCFFHQNMLCALNLDAPCTTFRAAERNLAPERQLSFTFRSERTRAAYAFPQPQHTSS